MTCASVIPHFEHLFVYRNGVYLSITIIIIIIIIIIIRWYLQFGTP